MALYVDELIGPDAVNTMPDATIEGARDHATPARTVDQAHKLIEEVKAAGIDFDKVVHEELVDEGVTTISDTYESLLDAIHQGFRAGARQLIRHELTRAPKRNASRSAIRGCPSRDEETIDIFANTTKGAP